jgi:hypothetical protein
MKKLLINFCPKCGHRVTEDVRRSLPNGGDWECFNCESLVEAYVLEDGDVEIKTETNMDLLLNSRQKMRSK